MKVEIWSDVVCPWCYVGKRRLERALADFPHRDSVEIVWRSFQLDPATIREPGVTSKQRLAQKIGVSEAQLEAMQDNLKHLAAAEGLDFDQDSALPTNTFDLHRVLHRAAEHGFQGAVKEAFLSAYFVEGKDLHDPDTIVAVAESGGLPADQTRAVLAEPTAHAEAVEDDRREAASLGANGVPFFVFDRKYGVSGAQPAEHFREVLDRAWGEANPIQVLTPTGQTDGGTCTDDSCAV